MNSLNTSADATTGPRSWNVERVPFQPLVAGTASISNLPGSVEHRAPGAAKLTIDFRVVEGRELLAEDERDLGPVSDQVLNEVRSRWPG